MSDNNPVQLCPKCGYLRRASDTTPDWQCPSCGIAYQKYHQYLERARKIPRPIAADVKSEPVMDDGSMWALVLTNILVLVLAFQHEWQLGDMLMVYWAQSIIIGIAYLLRILRLEDFLTDDFELYGEAVEPSHKVKMQTARLHAMIFGGTHLLYWLVLQSELFPHSGFSWDMALGCLAFALNHAFSFYYHQKHDQKGTTNIGMLMSVPFLRVVPMHVILVFGAMMPVSFSLVLFGAVKTLADCLMHKVEHTILSGGRFGTSD